MTEKTKTINYDDLDSENKSESDECISDMIESLQRLNLLSDEELSRQITASPKQYGQLFTAMGQFLSKSCGNINKIYEMALSLEFCDAYDKEIYTITHVKNEYGADIVITENETGERIGVEVKSSVVKKKNNYHANWNFTLNTKKCHLYYKEKDDEERIKLKRELVASLYKKMSNGFVVLQAMKGEEKLAEYQLNGVFMSFFCVTKILNTGKSHVLNLGCGRCKDCGEYHRITTLKKYENLLSERMVLRSGGVFCDDFDYFDDIEIKELYNDSIPTNCGRKEEQ